MFVNNQIQSKYPFTILQSSKLAPPLPTPLTFFILEPDSQVRQDVIPNAIAEIENVDDFLFTGDFADVVSELGEGVDERHHDFLAIGGIHAVRIGRGGESDLIRRRTNSAKHLMGEGEWGRKRQEEEEENS